ncbi:MAG: GNAT family N-acetyltransferase [Candidatus Thorarchaeota archaeon]
MIDHEILREHSDKSISTAIEGNLITQIEQDMMNVPEHYTPQVEKNKEMLRYYTGIQFVVENGVYVRQFQEADLERRVIEQIDFFRSLGVPHTWWFGAGSSPQAIEDILLENGLVKSEWDYPAMAVDLRRIEESRILEMMKQSGTTISIVKSEEQLKNWMEVFRATTGWPEEANDAYHHSSKTLLKDSERAVLILAECDEKPVGTSLALFYNGVVGLYSVGTLEEHRGKGIGSLVSLAAMAEGEKKGYEIAILFATQMGLNIYSRLGFNEYFKYRFFMDIPK